MSLLILLYSKELATEKVTFLWRVTPKHFLYRTEYTIPLCTEHGKIVSEQKGARKVFFRLEK